MAPARPSRARLSGIWKIGKTWGGWVGYILEEVRLARLAEDVPREGTVRDDRERLCSNRA